MGNVEPGTENRPYSYRNLILWQKAQALTLRIIEIVSRLPRQPAAQVIARQVVRSSSSIAANIAEGHGRFSIPAHRNHLSIAKGSACETDSWLDLMRGAGYIEPDVERELHDACEEVIRMLTAKIVQLERKGKSDARIGEAVAPYTVEDYAASERF